MSLNQKVDCSMTFKNAPEFEKSMAKVFIDLKRPNYSCFKITIEQVRVNISFLLKSWSLWSPQLKILL